MTVIKSGSATRLVLCGTFSDLPDHLGLLLGTGGAGAAVFALGLWVAWRHGLGTNSVVWLGVGTLVLALCALACSFRYGFALDRQAGTVTAWRSLVVTVRRAEGPFPVAASVNIALGALSEERTGPGRHFCVRLSPSDPTMGALELRSYVAARRVGEALAAFLAIPLHDDSSGVAVTRDAAHLDEPVRDRLLRTRELPDVCPVPPSRRLRVIQKDGGTVIALPTELPFWRTTYLVGGWLLLGLCLLVGLHDLLGNWGGLAPWGRFAGDAVCISVFVAPPLFFLLVFVRDRHRGRLTVSPREFRLIVPAVPRVQVTAIPAAEVEEVILHPGGPVPPRMPFDLSWGEWVLKSMLEACRLAFMQSPAPGITVRSDKVSVSFGTDLREDERRYLYALILHSLVDVHRLPGSVRQSDC